MEEGALQSFTVSFYQCPRLPLAPLRSTTSLAKAGCCSMRCHRQGPATSLVHRPGIPTDAPHLLQHGGGGGESQH